MSMRLSPSMRATASATYAAPSAWNFGTSAAVFFSVSSVATNATLTAANNTENLEVVVIAVGSITGQPVGGGVFIANTVGVIVDAEL